MSASGRPNPLDRLAPVAELPDRRSGAAGIVPDSPSRASETDDPVGPAEEPDHPGWGIGGMPTWLDTPPVRTPRRRTEPDDVVGTDDEEDDDDPFPRRRFAVAPPAALALIAVGVVACAVAAFGLFRGAESAPVVDFGAVAGSSRAPDSSPPAAPTAPTPTQMVVSVVGLVHQPGLVRLAPGARVAEAIDRAGGVRKNADLLSLNLAQVLRDGDQILVGYAGGEGQMSLRSAVVGAAGAPSPPAGAAPTGPGPPAGGSRNPPASGGLVNLNTATEADLDELPGVGPVTAKAILAWRERNGRFTSVDQLAEVDGIGPARLARLRDLVTV
ncbi:helix-hairpin-helix domain-containing protein [Gordonia terrae]